MIYFRNDDFLLEDAGDNAGGDAGGGGNDAAGGPPPDPTGGDNPPVGQDASGGNEGNGATDPDDPDDFGDMGDDMGEGGEGGEEGDMGGDDMGGDMGDDSSGSDPIKDAEKEIFSSLSPEQMAIKTKELKTRYVKMYDYMQNMIDRINDVPKTSNILKTINFVAKKLDDTAELISDYMESTFDANSYVENEINYNKFYAILAGLEIVLSKIVEEHDLTKKKEEDGE